MDISTGKVGGKWFEDLIMLEKPHRVTDDMTHNLVRSRFGEHGGGLAEPDLQGTEISPLNWDSDGGL